MGKFYAVRVGRQQGIFLTCALTAEAFEGLARNNITVMQGVSVNNR
jgi:viroplasmin and RNaseH domain-containing protein